MELHSSWEATSSSYAKELSNLSWNSDLLCGIVATVLGYRSGGTGSIPSTTRKKVVGLERGPLSLVSTTEELLDRKVASPVKKNREYGRRDPSHWPRGTLYPQKLAITSPTSGGRSVGIVRSRTQTMKFFYETRKFFTMLARSQYWYLFWARWNQSIFNTIFESMYWSS
jgi:hypothetical protein